MKKTTMGQKLAATTGVLLALIVLLSGVSLYNLSRIAGSLNTITTDAMPGLAAIAQLDSYGMEYRGNVWKALAVANDGALKTLEDANNILKQKIDDTLGAYEKTISQDEDRALFAKIGPAWHEYEEGVARALQLRHSGQAAGAVALYETDVAPRFDAFKAALRAEVAWGERWAQTSTQAANSAANGAKAVIWTLSLGAIGLGVVLTIGTVRSFNRNLRTAVGELRESADQVSAAAGQIAAASQTLAQGASEQAASVEETSASTEEIKTMAMQNTDHAKDARELAVTWQQQFVQTDTSLRQVVSAMAVIGSSSEKISRIIKVIDEIAFQTNILALNAAVEAARAGEAGMGFAVVADEVRNLAQRSAQAAKETATLIDEAITNARDGRAKVDQVAAEMHTMSSQTMRMKSLVEEVAAGSQEQSTGLAQVGASIVHIERVTQTVAAGAEESASAAEELSAQSESVRHIVNRLAAMVGAGARSAA